MKKLCKSTAVARIQGEKRRTAPETRLSSHRDRVLSFHLQYNLSRSNHTPDIARKRPWISLHSRVWRVTLNQHQTNSGRLVEESCPKAQLRDANIDNRLTPPLRKKHYWQRRPENRNVSSDVEVIRASIVTTWQAICALGTFASSQEPRRPIFDIRLPYLASPVSVLNERGPGLWTRHISLYIPSSATFILTSLPLNHAQPFILLHDHKHSTAAKMRSSSFLSFIAVFAAHYPVVNAAAIAPAEIDGNETSTLVARDDGFKYSCDGIGFVPQFRSLLFATCRRADGTVGGNTQINLDKCVGNNDGQLVAQAK